MFLLCLRDYSSLRFLLYDWMIAPMRSMWYREVLLQCPMDASVLDVCVRTASSLIANRDVVRSKKLILTGVDYDAGYVRAAQDNIIKYGLEKQVNIVHSSILDDTTSRFDVIYFSDSFLTMPKRLD
ncbi:type 11 methyltransferase, partial [Trypanosoma cruzi]